MTGIPRFLDNLPEGHTATPCKEQPTLFVDASRTTPLKAAIEGCRPLCARCPVRQACLDHAINNGERDGIWGGHTTEERDQLAHDRATLPAT